MQIFTKVSDLQNHLSQLRGQGLSIGFVPTMGALHSGHLALIDHASRENDISIISIFVNPTQFNNKTDLAKYPREVDSDIAKLEKTGCDIIFLPSEEEMYPEKTESVKINLNGLDTVMEGAHRPGHFDGVATIVGRFFEIVNPTKAYFGEKDFQQLLIIRQLTKVMGFDVEIIPHPIERSQKGLALSSRNQLLSAEDQEKSLIIWQSLNWMKENYKDHSPQELINLVSQRFEGSELELEYAQIVNENTLLPLDSWSNTDPARAFIAAYISGVRLIDNLQLI
ncbi:pantoate--beta-alanine ligase [Owenweeksia hongkongensis DSM 17368]|uniref:Pantothenate synthetase n=1 Tax=Owenweeksia hongkongensis (strain DSM 17368 / CIP 108786 / JCM 12287 / NRRL B-23963 / UST20020801) TaxID=926562 RepID=G8QZJ9_OWEHD|nr:pantoate--beta-alanine ligase [Owenweeksia hongkongensis]AEV33652.1 pantoate--beta-alanine ligase [Owenweeksia hongkongensis DSM 17368]